MQIGTLFASQYILLKIPAARHTKHVERAPEIARLIHNSHSVTYTDGASYACLPPLSYAYWTRPERITAYRLYATPTVT